MGWREIYRNMPRQLSGHAKKQLVTRLTNPSLLQLNHIVDQILHDARLTDIKFQNGSYVCYFECSSGWQAVGKPGKRYMHILTIYPTVH